MTTPRMGFSCILPTYNRCAVVERTLHRLLACDYPAERFEILVADNSTDGTPEMVQRVAAGARAPVRLLWSDERLPAVKRNAAVRAAAFEHVVLMNDDLWVRPDFLSEHEAAHLRWAETGPGALAVLGHVEQSPQMPWTPFVEWYRPFAYHEIAGHIGVPLEWLYFWSMNLSLPRGEMVGRNLMFHEDWAQIGSEDVELGYRWVGAGNRLVYHPPAWGEHFHPHTVASAARLQESVGRGLRDLEVLVPEPRLLERYGVLSTRSRPRALARGLVREALFNRVTAPRAARWLDERPTGSALARWMYWKVLLHYTNRGYRAAPRRSPVPLATAPAPVPARERTTTS